MNQEEITVVLKNIVITSKDGNMNQEEITTSYVKKEI